VGWTWLRLCLAAEFSHAVRGSPPALSSVAAEAFDLGIESCFWQLVGVPAPTEEGDAARAACILRLPTRFGGCGLISQEQIAACAYVASTVDCQYVLQALDAGAAAALLVEPEWLADPNSPAFAARPAATLASTQRLYDALDALHPHSISVLRAFLLARRAEEAKLRRGAAYAALDRGQLLALACAPRASRAERLEELAATAAQQPGGGAAGEEAAPEPSAGKTPARSLQNALCRPLHRAWSEALLESLASPGLEADRARFLSQRGWAGTGWLTAGPWGKTALGTTELRACFQLHLGVGATELPDELQPAFTGAERRPVTVRRDGEELPVMVTRRTAFNVFWSSSAWNKTPVHNA